MDKKQVQVINERVVNKTLGQRLKKLYAFFQIPMVHQSLLCLPNAKCNYKKKTALIFKELKRKWLMLIQCLMYVHPLRILDALLCVVLSPSLEAAVHGQLWNSMNTVWLCSYTAPLRDSSDGADHRWSVFAVKGRKGIKKYIRDLFHWRFLNMQVNFLR